MIRFAPLHIESSHFVDAVKVYMVVFGQTNFVASTAFFRKYTSYPYYQGRIVLDESMVVGLAFGALSEPGNWWHDRVAEQVGFDHPALQDAWVLVELGILAPYRNRGIGTQLHNHIVQSQPLPNLLLSTQQDNLSARRLYERLGWDYLHSGFAFSRGDEPYVVMYRKRDQSPDV